MMEINRREFGEKLPIASVVDLVDGYDDWANTWKIYLLTFAETLFYFIMAFIFLYFSGFQLEYFVFLRFGRMREECLNLNLQVII